MLTPSERERYQDLYQDYYGENLGDIVGAIAQYDGNLVGFLNMRYDEIDKYIKQHNPQYWYDDLKVYQKDAVDLAVIAQCFYVAHGVDFGNFGGLDINTGAITDKKTIAERKISSNAIEILNTSEVVYTLKGTPWRKIDG
jgi:hypothetical protein